MAQSILIRKADGTFEFLKSDGSGRLEAAISGITGTVNTQLTGSSAENVTNIKLLSNATEIPASAMSGRRTVLVSNNGNGGNVYVGEAGIDVGEGIKIAPNCPPVEIMASQSEQVYGISEPFYFLNGGISFSYRSLVYLPRRDEFIGSIGEKIYSSTDRGKTWAVVSSELSGAVTVEASTLFVNRELDDGEYELIAGSRAGVNGLYIFRSQDSGRTWSTVSAVDRTALCSIGDFTKTDSGIILGVSVSSASNGRGIIRSTDNGATWSQISMASLRSVEFTEGQTVFAGTSYATSDNLYRSTDDGENWSAVASFDRNAFGLFYIGSDTLIVRSQGDGTDRKIRKFGNIHAAAVGDITNTIVHDDVGPPAGRTAAVFGNRIILGEDDGLLISEDSGDNWVLCHTHLTSDNILKYGPKNILLSSENEATLGIYASSDGGIVPISVVEGA